MNEQKILIILGPTSSGKTDLAVDLAKKYNGEVISADSRQVFKGLDIGSGKVTKKEMRGIPHHLLDVASPNRAFSVIQFKKKADSVIKDILKRGKLPIIAGGTGFYIQAIVDNIVLPEVSPNLTLRKELEGLLREDREKAIKEMGRRLKKLDHRRFREIDQKNPRRLMRAIEIATALGKVPKLKLPVALPLSILQIGIRTDDDVLKKRIGGRFEKRVKAGIVAEAENLHKKGMTWKRMNEIGLAHKHIASYLKNKISKEEMIENSIKEEKKYAKRQKTWFKRDKRIIWVNLENHERIDKLVTDFL
ncbi:tRNA (adenosine(37)-N6)-dimethylallyltransferase MiaA [Candidatus Campbellbacteria bacterium RIFOXYC2_FULL_35_25]|uniref:tRNA dimethylallyltransferase n=1 Tax=Candidatus Campbellbacteria bacterium RIFOXYC2_FULL_35_25 TaxID=1797582 RepID=A0A1F5EJX0_9BACT|nr:MAG: tRNA (adenosine(37)-N6)-dimethylallyltransferase MiaA [Candidatus Campbellbacteria bacterium RIFOXYC2_FULL_35_25]